MKIINIIGSPRKKGTSARIAKSFVETSEENGASVKSYYLNGLNYRGCQGCEACHSKLDKCVLKDDAEEILDAMREADVIVFSSPVYYGDTTGQFKSFLDRTWSHVDVNYENENPYTSRIPKGKHAVVILSQGNTKDGHLDLVERFQMFMDIYGLQLHVIRATGLNGQVNQDVTAYQEEANALAKELTKELAS